MRELATGRSDAEASPVALPRRWLATIFLVFAAYAGLVALTSALSVHRTWAVFALAGYAAAAASTCWPRRGVDLALLVSVAGALALPLGWLAASGAAQREIYVISRSAWMLLHHGTPYRSAAALAGTTNPDAYNPYMPAMSLFGAGNQTLHGGAARRSPDLVHGRVRRALPAGPAGRRGGGRATLDGAGDRLAADRLPPRGRRRRRAGHRADVPGPRAAGGRAAAVPARLGGARVRDRRRPEGDGLAGRRGAARDRHGRGRGVARPPAAGHRRAATWRIIATLVLLFLLAPSTRVGYFTYPLTLWAWLRVSSLDARLARIRLTT